MRDFEKIITRRPNAFRFRIAPACFDHSSLLVRSKLIARTRAIINNKPIIKYIKNFTNGNIILLYKLLAISGQESIAQPSALNIHHPPTQPYSVYARKLAELIIMIPTTPHII